MILEGLDLDAAAFARGTGWEVQPQGACRGDVCVPLPSGPLDITVVAERLGMPLLHDEAHGRWALGPASVTGRALATAEAGQPSDLIQGPTDLYEGNWLDDVRAAGAETYYEPFEP